MSAELEQHYLTRDKITAAMNAPEVPYDVELDDPRFHDPGVLADIEEMQQRFIKSSNQNIEESLRQYELSYNHAETHRQRWPGQKRWMGRENEEMRKVRILHPYTFLAKLRRAGVDARVNEDRNARVWLNPWSTVGRIGVNARQFGEERTITTLQYPYAPEYSIMRFNEYDVPLEERFRGWRTTLLVLIVAQVITEKEAEQAFGPAIGPASEFYREQLQINRRVNMGFRL
jgi:hypothetical protein